MHLLQVDNNILLAMYFVGLIVSFCIFYLIIKGAVAAGTKEQRRLLEIQNRILIHNLKKEGAAKETIEELTDVKY